MQKQVQLNPMVCTWIPGTMDLVRLSCPQTKQDFSITLHQLQQLVGNKAVEALYLHGRYKLDVTLGLEKKLQALSS